MPLFIPLPTDSPDNDISQYVPLLLSAIEGFLQLQQVWDKDDYSDAFQLMEALKLWIVQNIPLTPQLFPRAAFWFHGHGVVVAGAALLTTIDTANAYNLYWTQGAGAQNDEIEFKVHLEAGTYTLSVRGITANSFGIQTILFNGVSKGTMDWYLSSLTRVVKTITGIAASYDGLYTISSKAATKNASSSGYALRATDYWLTRTG